jgi:hypothetical protein
MRRHRAAISREEQMSYLNAGELLPPELLLEVQTYVQGSLVYIPRSEAEERLRWGARSGARESLDRRNAAIREAKSRGSSIDELADEYSLSPGGIRKILYGPNKRC